MGISQLEEKRDTQQKCHIFEAQRSYDLAFIGNARRPPEKSNFHGVNELHSIGDGGAPKKNAIFFKGKGATTLLYFLDGGAAIFQFIKKSSSNKI